MHPSRKVYATANDPLSPPPLFFANHRNSGLKKKKNNTKPKQIFLREEK